MLELDAKSSALVLIDLQKGILNNALVPHSGTDVVARSQKLAAELRAAGGTVVLVHVGFSSGLVDATPGKTDEPRNMPAVLPPDFTALADGLAQPGDVLVLKRQWGAFYGTELDLQLRRRHVRTLVVGGVATNFGVESTVRSAWEHGYDVVVAEDLCASRSVELHAFPIKHIFPRVSRVVTTADLKIA